jgi:hypothetical protein
MSKGNTFETELLKMILNGTPIPNLCDNAADSPLANLYVALHTADPGENGTQATNEIAYTGYARVAIARNNSTPAWNVSNGVASPVATITFPAGTGGSGTATHFSIGVAASGASKILYSGTITNPIVCGAGVTPQLTTAGTITED